METLSLTEVSTFRTTREARRLSRSVREIANHPTAPIVAVDGFAEPTVVGDTWHYETRTGIRIHRPSAYARRGWSSMVYCPSTAEIQVGRGWLIQQGLI